MNAVPDGADTISADDREVVLALATRRGMTEWPAPRDTVIVVGDYETSYELVRRGGRICFEVVQRGHRLAHALFTSVADAVRFLVFTLADQRHGPEWTPIEHADFAPGTGYAPSPEGWILHWPGGQAVSPQRRLLVSTAREFSWVATATPADIAASYRHHNGEPLFDLGHRVQVRYTDPNRTDTPPP